MKRKIETGGKKAMLTMTEGFYRTQGVEKEIDRIIRLSIYLQFR